MPAGLPAFERNPGWVASEDLNEFLVQGTRAVAPCCAPGARAWQFQLEKGQNTNVLLAGKALIGFRGGEASIGKRGREALVREQKRA